MSSAHVIAAEAFERIHPSKIEGADRIRGIVDRLRDESIVLSRGMNRRIDRETAMVEFVDGVSLRIRTKNFEQDDRAQILLNFALDGQPYFFATQAIRTLRDRRIELSLPNVIYKAERRDHDRTDANESSGRMVEIRASGVRTMKAEIADTSDDGLSVLVPSGAAETIGPHCSVRFLDGARAGRSMNGEIKNRFPSGREGWTRIGLGVTAAPHAAPLAIERRNRIVESSRWRRAQTGWKVLSASARVASGRVLEATGRYSHRVPTIRVLDYRNSSGEKLRAIVDSWGDTRGAPAVVIPPAWGKTKETLLPLAASLVEGFRTVNEPITVIRYDGIRKRGESHNDAPCKEKGREHHRFTFSQGVRDIAATIDFLETAPEFRPESVILVSFSASSIEARRAVARDRRIRGWVCVVGSADIQSMMRVISGGVDYAVGLERGERFGLQEILGVEVDMDRAGIDAFQHDLTYLEDARRDMSEIDVPITWIHGRHDAWMNAQRVLDALSRGDTSVRRFIEVPTGHTLKSSREAIETFQLIASEAARMALGRTIDPATPDLAALELRRRAERGRLPRAENDLRGFWKDYLLGPDGGFGIELMTSIRAYDDLMRVQVRELELSPGDCVVDVGSGTGAFPQYLARLDDRVPLRIVELDYVRAGLVRTRRRLAESALPESVRVAFAECDFDLSGSGGRVPLVDESVDAVLGSLILSYVRDPEALLRELFRILRPGGRIVVSSLCRDADMSKLYLEGLDELRSGRARAILGPGAESRIDESARVYLNQAARLLDLEEEGEFRFWDPNEFADLIESAGFRSASAQKTMGDPAQAVVATASRPD